MNSFDFLCNHGQERFCHPVLDAGCGPASRRFGGLQGEMTTNDDIFAHFEAMSCDNSIGYADFGDQK